MPRKDPELDASIAHTLEVDARLLVLLPELLRDLEELGTPCDEIVSAVRSVGVPPGSTALDLGSGKGAVAVALAERAGLHVEGVDGFPPFVRAARRRAARHRVGSRCRFRKDDIRRLLGQPAEFDLVLLLSVGPILGDHRKTMAGLRTLVRPGGHIVIDDGFLAPGATAVPGTEAYVGHADTLGALSAFGDVLVREVSSPAERTRATNERNTELIRARARRLRERHPEAAELIDAYVARQEHETKRLGSDVIDALWVFRRT